MERHLDARKWKIYNSIGRSHVSIYSRSIEVAQTTGSGTSVHICRLSFVGETISLESYRLSWHWFQFELFYRIYDDLAITCDNMAKCAKLSPIHLLHYTSKFKLWTTIECFTKKKTRKKQFSTLRVEAKTLEGKPLEIDNFELRKSGHGYIE